MFRLSDELEVPSYKFHLQFHLGPLFLATNLKKE
jgi:hypothetical protein